MWTKPNLLPALALVSLACADDDPTMPDASSAQQATSEALTGTVTGPGVLFAGSVHRPLGEASLDVDSQGRLRISSTGNGDDGIAVGRAGSSAGYLFEGIDLSGNGAALHWRAVLGQDGTNQTQTTVLSLSNNSGVLTIDTDFVSPGREGRVELMRDGESIWTDHPGSMGEVLTIADIGDGIVLEGLISSPFGLGLALRLRFADDVKVATAGRRHAIGDELVITISQVGAVHFAQQEWTFTPPVGTRRMEVIATDPSS